MSTQPTIQSEPAQGPKCVGTEYLRPLSCDVCGSYFVPERGNQVNCSNKCRSIKKHRIEAEKRKANVRLRGTVRNIAFAHINRDKAFTFDGRYEGPLNQPITLIITLRKDTGYKAFPRDVHVRAIEPKHSTLTADDKAWAAHQQAFPHSLSMPRSFNNFCQHCAEMVIDRSARSVRFTQGLYLPIEHQCNSVRVYDLAGKLLEVKPL